MPGMEEEPHPNTDECWKCEGKGCEFCCGTGQLDKDERI